MSIPAICEKCGHLFALKEFFMGANVRQVTITNSRTRCPKCGSTAKILDGTYEYYNGMLETVKGSHLTIEATKRLSEITQEALNSDLNSSEFRDRLLLIDEGTGLKLTNFYDADMTNKFIIIALSALAIYLAAMIAEFGVKTTDAIIDNFSQNGAQVDK